MGEKSFQERFLRVLIIAIPVVLVLYFSFVLFSLDWMQGAFSK